MMPDKRSNPDSASWCGRFGIPEVSSSLLAGSSLIPPPEGEVASAEPMAEGVRPFRIP